MLRNVLTFSLVLAANLQAQCWAPTNTPGLWNLTFKECHAQALPGSPSWDWRFSTTNMTPEQTALAKAIAMVEQGLQDPSQINPGEANKEGDNGDARGPLQIHKSNFMDAQEFMPQIGPGALGDIYPSHVEWTCWEEDMYEPEKALHRSLWWANSCGVWYAYGMRYSPFSMMNMTATGAEIIARRHNGGPRGDTRDSTEGYWDKVKSQLLQHYPGVIPGL